MARTPTSSPPAGAEARRSVCPRHGVPTRLACVSCGTPICLRCQVSSDVGLKCPSCAGVEADASRAAPRRRIYEAAMALGLAVLIAAAAVAIRLASSGSPAPSPAPAAVGRWQSLPPLTALRGATSALRLRDGRVLVAGGGIGSRALAGTEILDPASRRWSRGGDLQQARRDAPIVLLRDGRALVAGGVAGGRPLASAEIYDPASGQWTATAPMTEPRLGHTLTLLADGRVLAAGGTGADGDRALSSAEVWDPAITTWSPVPGGMRAARSSAAAALLRDGRVLVAGGTSAEVSAPEPLASAELFDPAGNIFTATGSLTHPRRNLTATVLSDGRVLTAGGLDAHETVGIAEIYDPAVGSWRPTGQMVQPRQLHRADALPGGTVFASGGQSVDGGARTALASAEIYDAAAGRWQRAATMSCPRSDQGQVVLAGGEVLVVGGDAALPGEPPTAQSCAELFSLNR